MTESPPGRIFLCHRRDETAYPAGWLYDRLGYIYGNGQVSWDLDIDSIELGDDFVEVITRAVTSCDVLLVLIGDAWLTGSDLQGRRRLDDPDDFVRLEIEAALTGNVPVIPILVDGARMPPADQLPTTLSRLTHRQALELSPARFDSDTARLLKVLDEILAEVRLAQDGAASPTSQPEPDHPREQVAASGVFISYRRDDSAGVAGRLYDLLTQQFDESSVFMDVDSVELGLPFQDVIHRHIAQCGVFLVLIGDRWLDAADSRGNRRLADPYDSVRIEIESALERDIYVIPVLIDRTEMPHRDELPESLVPLAGRNGTRVRHESFRSDVLRLIEFAQRKTRPTAR